MKILFAIALLASGFAAIHATAAPVTIEYTATVSAMSVTRYDQPGHPSTPVLSNDYFGFTVTAGESVKGYFTYDTNTVMDWAGNADEVIYRLSGEYFQQSLKFQNGLAPLTFNNDSYLYAVEVPGRLSVDAFGYRDTGDGSNMRTSFSHPAPYTQLDARLPGADEWGGFGQDSTLSVYQASADGRSALRLDGQITSFRVLSPVPEPAIWAMLGLGLGLIGLSRRGRSAAVAAAARR